MTLKKQTLAMCISLALMGSLTACSGSKNSSSPANNNTEQVARLKAEQAKAEAERLKAEAERLKAEQAKAEEERLKAEQAKAEAERLKAEQAKAEEHLKAEQAKEEAAKQREKLETVLDPEGKTKWRQFADFIPSSDTSANNPLQASQNGKISPQEGAAAYLNGASYYKDGTAVKDFRKLTDRATTDYNANALHQADIDPERVQQLVIHNQAGQAVANIHFINQSYTTYSTWKSAEAPQLQGDTVDSIMSGYVAVPTKPNTAIENKGKVTYRGHTLAQKAAGSSEIHKGNIELNADFNNKTIDGKLTQRNDMLLDSSIKRFAPDITELYTTDPDDLEYDDTLKVISPAEYAQKEAEMAKELETKLQNYRTVDVTINPTKISSGSTISFHNPLGALSYKDGEKTRNTGVIGGIFAGDNAQEVVGEIQGSSHFMSFGATEVAK